MSPDSVETRLRLLETTVARLEQRMDDLIARLTDQLKDVDDDVRAFAPMITDIIDIRGDIRFLRGALEELQRQVRDDKKERAELAETRRKERKADRWALATAVLMTVGLVIGAIQILGGFS